MFYIANTTVSLMDKAGCSYSWYLYLVDSENDYAYEKAFCIFPFLCIKRCIVAHITVIDDTELGPLYAVLAVKLFSNQNNILNCGFNICIISKSII